MYLHDHILKDLELGLSSSRLDTLKELSNAPGRFYHTWDHSVSVLSWVRWAEDQTNQQYRPLQLAALYHDVIYDVTAPSGRNEEWSADFLKSHFPHETEAYDLIRLTSKHGSIARGTNELSEKEKIFLDCDIAYMFAEPRFSVFSWLNILVIEEYSYHFPRGSVMEARLFFLKNMADKGLFLSDLFYYKFEATALSNLKRLIDLG